MTLPACKLSVTVITRDEEAQIGACLESVGWADEIVVIDTGSADRTLEICRKYTPCVETHPWEGYSAAKNAAIERSTGDWILSLDADEALSPELVREMERRLPQLMQSDRAGAVLRRQTWYMGAPMRWYRPMMGERLGRLYNRQRARWTNVRVHESLQFDGPTETFTHPFIHLNNPTLVHKQLKTLRYAELKARDWADRAKPAHMWLTPFVHAAAFLKDYVLRLAFLDGWRGYVVAQIAASYAVYKRMRYYEMRRNPASREMAASLLRGYGLDP
jgi:glycosyltransferase involved in cell wall biosynthesis